MSLALGCIDRQHLWNGTVAHLLFSFPIYHNMNLSTNETNITVQHTFNQLDSDFQIYTRIDQTPKHTDRASVNK